MWKYQRRASNIHGKFSIILGFLLGFLAMPFGVISVDFLYFVFSSDIFQFLFGIYVFAACFMMLAANLYMVFSGYGLVPTRGNLEKAPSVVQVSYRFFYRPIVIGTAFLVGGVIGNAMF